MWSIFVISKLIKIPMPHEHISDSSLLLMNAAERLTEQIYRPFYYFFFENFIVCMQIKHSNASRNHNLLFQDRLNKWQLRSGSMLNDPIVMQY